jgi:tetratricopeptide (TPR) repeat protein
VVEELSQFKTICLLVTSRITTLPPRCRRPEIPTLSMEAACNIFYDIYSDRGRSTIVNNLLERLDFHALSITLLATTASHNAWDYPRLAKEWDIRRAQVLQTDYNQSLAAAIELSLTSPTFRSLGPDARDLLGVIAFFPQGIDENNLDWLFPTISNVMNVFDKFCALSLTYRGNRFTTMLAPIRDYLAPRDPRSSPLLCTTRDRYISRLSVDLDPGKPKVEEARWIISEDVNVEHLLDVFATIGDDIWDACRHFIDHLYRHKPRPTMLKSKIEALPDDHPSKPRCLSQLSQLLGELGNTTERKRLLTHTLELERRRGDGSEVAYTLQQLSDVNRLLHLYEEGIQQAREALEIFKRTGNTAWEMQCLNDLAWLLFDDKQLDAANDVASRAIDLATENGDEVSVCRFHGVIANILQSKGEKKKAVHHFEAAIRIASLLTLHDTLFWNHHDLAKLFREEGKFDDANVHTERAKSYATDESYKLGRAMELQSGIWYRQLRLEEAKSEILRALGIYEKLGAAEDAGECRKFLQKVERAMKNRSAGFQGKLLKSILSLTSVDSYFLA